MRYCPKCHSFYEDERLRFCLKDGVPLVDVKQTDSIWNEGTSFIRETQRVITRETRIRQMKTVVSMLITTVLVIMVVSVITLNSWIYLSEPEKEIAQNVVPTPAGSPETSPLPTPPPGPEPTPTSTESPAPAPTPTTTRTQTQTPTPTPRLTLTSLPPVCNPANEEDIIKRNYGSYFREHITKFGRQYLIQERQEVAVSTTVRLNDFDARVSPDCRSASINHRYQATLKNLSQIPMSKSFSCTKGLNWICR